MSRGWRAWVAGGAAAGLLLLGDASRAFAYLKFGFAAGGQVVTLKWSAMPVRYYVTDAGTPEVSSASLRAAVGRAFSTWQATGTAAVTYEFAGFTAALPSEDDGRSTLGFMARPDLDRVLAATSFLVDAATGELLESDIFFNTAATWSTAAAGEPGRFDLETIALHEVGHLSGLGHSALGETQLAAGGRQVVATASIMFPLAFGRGSVANRTPHADDLAGLSDIYPASRFRSETGSISGRVTKNGTGVFGAHVTALHLETGALVGGFSLNARGEFVLAGLLPGAHVVRVEPLDDAELDSFFDDTTAVDVGFRAAFHPRLAVVPRGGDSGAIDLKVASR